MATHSMSKENSSTVPLWQATVHGVAQSRTRLSDQPFHTFVKQKQTYRQRTDLWLPRGRGTGRAELGFGTSTCKLLCTDRVSTRSYFIAQETVLCLMCVLVAQLCLTLCEPMGCSLPGSSVCGISQERKHNGKQCKKKKKDKKSFSSLLSQLFFQYVSFFDSISS